MYLAQCLLPVETSWLLKVVVIVKIICILLQSPDVCDRFYAPVVQTISNVLSLDVAFNSVFNYKSVGAV